jgi:predicted nucleic acid-binding protein
VRRVTYDASCLVAAVCTWHEHHSETLEAIERSVERKDELVLVAHALAEAYAVLTRLPAPHRISPENAVTLLDANWGGSETIALTAREYWKLLRSSASAGTAGGGFYDALIAACAKKARAQFLFTWNVRHLARYQDDTLTVLSPGGT